MINIINITNIINIINIIHIINIINIINIIIINISIKYHFIVVHSVGACRKSPSSAPVSTWHIWEFGKFPSHEQCSKPQDSYVAISASTMVHGRCTYSSG